MSYEVVLENFSGPLDLLLHLIQRQELNIHDIPIALVTEQYLSYLHAMEELSLEIASEFVVMAATLLLIKSRMLLPRPTRTSDDEEVELDPREALVQQLLEYQRCKWAAEQLKSRELLQSQLFTRDPLDLRVYAAEEIAPLQGVSMWDLVDAYRKLLLRIPQEDRVAEIKGRVMSVEDMMEILTERMRKWRRATFIELIQHARTRPELVTAFLALLELVKDRIVQCVQATTFGDIEILWNEELAG